MTSRPNGRSEMIRCCTTTPGTAQASPDSSRPTPPPHRPPSAAAPRDPRATCARCSSATGCSRPHAHLHEHLGHVGRAELRLREQAQDAVVVGRDAVAGVEAADALVPLAAHVERGVLSWSHQIPFFTRASNTCQTKTGADTNIRRQRRFGSCTNRGSHSSPSR